MTVIYIEGDKILKKYMYQFLILKCYL